MFVGVLDCDTFRNYCNQQQIPHYPFLKLYGRGTDSGGTVLHVPQSELPANIAVLLLQTVVDAIIPATSGSE